MYARTLKAVFLLCLCFFGSIAVTPVLAQIGGFTVGFGSVAKNQSAKQTIGVEFTTSTGIYTYGCYGQTAGPLTISGTNAGDFTIEKDGISGVKCGRDTTLKATIVFTPHGLGRREAELNLSVTADHRQFQGDFRVLPCKLVGIGIEDKAASKPKPAPAPEPSRLFFYIAYLNRERGGHWWHHYNLDKFQSFPDAAATWERDIKKKYSFNPNKDKFIEVYVRSPSDFQTAWNDIDKDAQQGHYIVAAGGLFTHASIPLPSSITSGTVPITGLEFGAEPGTQVISGGTLTPGMIASLPKLDWSSKGFLELFGCNTARLQLPNWCPASVFAKKQGVVAFGEMGFAYFSENEDIYEEISSNSKNVYLGAFKRGWNVVRFHYLPNGVKIPSIPYTP